MAATLPSLALAAERRETQTALNQTRQELVQSQKLEALGQLTGGVAHDFNNLLAAIAGGLRSLNRHEEEKAKTMAALDETLNRATTLTQQLLTFARREPLRAEVVKVEAIMAGVETLIGQSLGPSIRVVVRVAPGIWPIEVERSQLELALLNLALNARDAMPNGGDLFIQVENVVTGREQCVSFSVSDTGSGMNADVRARAFEPFFSTKPAGAGTGLGLAQVYDLAKRSRGQAAIESEPSAGTTVTITLPRAERPI
jgi:signal transduction histidine kinase